MSIGTRKPNPMGPRMGGLPTTVGSGTAGAVMYSPGVPGRRCHRRNMVEEAAVFVVGDKQSRLRPLRWIEGQSGQNRGQGAFTKK